jgi:hypothetical protein
MRACDSACRVKLGIADPARTARSRLVGLPPAPCSPAGAEDVWPFDGHKRMKPTKVQIAGFIRDHAIELRKLALSAKLRVLAFLLEMVIVEADERSRHSERRRRS